jgi:hypothetical protein
VADEIELLKDLGREVTDPDEGSTNRARTVLERRIAAEERPRRLRPWRPLHLRWGVAVTAAVLVVGGFGFGLGAWTTPSGVAGTSFVGVGFLPAKGWTVIQTGRFGDSAAPAAIAANVPLDPDDDLRDAPVATLEALPAGGVLISARFGVRGDLGTDSAFPLRPLPLRIAAAERLSPALDPLPLARRLGRYRLRAGVERYNVDARIYFGTASPTASQLAVAQSQLNRLVVAAERVTLFARPTVHDRNQLITLLGSVDSNRADEPITIEAKECGQTSFVEISGTHTNEGGGWTLQYAPVITTTLRAEWKGVRSAPVTIQDRAWVQIGRRPRNAQGYGFNVAVRAKLQFWKRHVIVQRFVRRVGRWTDVKKVVLTETGAAPGSTFVWSSADFRVQVPKGTRIRAVFPLTQSRPCYLAGYSNQLET